MRPLARSSRTLLTLLLVLTSALVGAACDPGLRRFPLAPTVWDDPDREHVQVAPRSAESGIYGDALDNTYLAPVSELLAPRTVRESINVNALDEVPDSSWFVNRIGRHDMSPAEVARGVCAGPSLDEKPGPWVIVSAKVGGATPGLVVTAPDGAKYLIKFGGRRSAAAEAIGPRLFHAIGYHTPCSQVVRFDRQRLTVAPDATLPAHLGRKKPFTVERLEKMLAQVARDREGRLVASASRFLPGKILGNFRYVGVRKDDPNDVVPHEHRRELRAARLVAAWLARFDTREQNSMDTLVEEKGQRHVRHYQLDFGDSLGYGNEGEEVSRRVNHAYFFDVGQILLDLVSLGAIPRPWYYLRPRRRAGVFATYQADHFVPSKWRPITRNPAFVNMTWKDALWMVRILVRFTDEHLKALVRTARLEEADDEEHLWKTLAARRDLIAQEYLRRYVPLADLELSRVRQTPRGHEQILCFTDLGIRHAGVAANRVVYGLELRGGRRLERLLGTSVFRAPPGRRARSCVPLPLGSSRPSQGLDAAVPDHDPRRYAVLRIAVQQSTRLPETRLEVHLYDRGPRDGFYVAGIDRTAHRPQADLYLQ